MVLQMFVYWISLFFISLNTEIQVSHDYLPEIPASSIAEGAQLFTIKGEYLTIRDFLVSDDAYYLTPGEEESKGFATSIIKVNRRGEFLGEIYRSSDGSIIQGIAMDSVRNTLFSIHAKKIAVIDLSTWKVQKVVEFEKGIENAVFFQGKLALTRFEVQKDSKHYYLEMYDPESLKLIQESLKLSFKLEDNPAIKNMARHSSLIENDGELWVSIGEVNDVYSSKNQFKGPIISFSNLYQGRQPSADILFSANQGIVGRFATTGFRYMNHWYTFFYDLKEQKQFLSRVGADSGVYDDFHRSGNYSLQFTNSGNHLFSYQKPKMNEDSITVILFDIKS